MNHKSTAIQVRQERAIKALSHLAIAFPDRVFTSTQEEDDAIVRCVDNTSQVYAAVGVVSMWVCLGNIEVVCKNFGDVTDVFRKLIEFERLIGLEHGSTMQAAVEATFVKYAAQIKAVPGFESVTVTPAEDEYQHPFVLEVFAPGVATPFLRIELEFCNPNPQHACAPGKEYAAYFWLQEARYKMTSFDRVIGALKKGEPFEPVAETLAPRVQAVAPSNLFSVCGSECAVRARDVVYCLPELLRQGFTDFTLQTVETRLCAVLPRMRSLSPISNLINDQGTVDVYVGRIPKVT